MAIGHAGLATDFCGSVTVRASAGAITGDCVRTQIWNVLAMDECGNDATCQVTYTWRVNTEIPVINTTAVSGDLGCNPTLTDPIFTGVDDCSEPIIPLVNTTGPTNADCGYTQTWTATFIDEGGLNADPVIITYTWKEDKTVPAFTACPAGPVSLGLNPAQTPTEAMAISSAGAVTDLCGIPTVIAEAGAITGDCVRTQIWTVTAMDGCGNKATCMVTFTWTVDTGKPIINTTAVSGDLGCNPTIVTPPDFRGVDDCSVAFIPNVNTSEPINTGCLYTQTWTATYRDGAGMDADPVIITYTWTIDTEAPVFAGCPQAPVDLGNNPAQLPTGAMAIAAAGVVTDLCGTPAVRAESGAITGDCVKIQIWTITAVDGCGNDAICTVNFTWTSDTEKPVISTTAKTSDLGCNPTIVPPIFTGLDNCGGAFVPVLNTSGVINIGCVNTQTWTATYTDASGNVADPVVITFTWTLDMSDPVFTACPAAPVNLGYNPAQLPTQAIAIAGAGTVTDLCSVPAVSASGGPITGDYTKTQVWIVTAVDGCGNGATCQVTFTWTVGEGNPEFIGCPAGPINLGCNPVPPVCADAMARVMVTGGSGGTLTPACLPGNINENGCQRTQTFTLTLGNSPENQATCLVTYIWTVDSEPPVVTGVPAVTGGCNLFSPTSAAIPPMATDNCGTTVLKPGYPQNSNIIENGCQRLKYRTWIYLDDCGNESEPFVQTITWTVDVLPPQLNGIKSIALGCNPVDPISKFVEPEASDNCGTPLLKNGYPQNGSIITNGCDYSKTRTWIYVDACGNESLPFVQTLTWTLDTEAPIVTGKTEVDLGCNPENPTAKYVTPMATDNCGTPEVKKDYPRKTNIVYNGCQRSKTLTWIFVDACGNESEPFVQTLTWTVDPDKPVFIGCPATPIDLGYEPVQMPDEAMAIAAAGIATDLCGIPKISAIGGMVTGDCMKIQNWTVKAMDGCGNESTCKVVYTWEVDCGYESHCTYTQGFYGNTGGKTCSGKSALDLMIAAFDNNQGAFVVFGDQSMPVNGKYFKLYYADISEGHIFNMLPGSGVPDALKGSAAYNLPDSWNLVPLSTNKGTFGKIFNNLLSQTITLWFNTQNDPDLGDFVIEDKFLITQKSAECGSDIPVENSVWYTEVPVEVINYLKAHYPSVNVRNLLTLANDVLAGLINSRELSPSAVNAAVDAINNAFDECRILVGFSSTKPDASVIPPASSVIPISAEEMESYNPGLSREFTEANLTVYPNPFATIVKFELEVIFDTHVRLEIYSHNGSFIGVFCDEDLKQGDIRTIEFDGTKYPHTTFMYKLTTTHTTKSGTVMRTK